jgi:H+/gluconate symporter-like permease
MNINFDKKEARQIGLVEAALLYELRKTSTITLKKIESAFMRDAIKSLKKKGVIVVIGTMAGLLIKMKGPDHD